MFVLGPNDLDLEWKLQPRWVRLMDKPGDFEFASNNPFPVFWVMLNGTRTVEIGGSLFHIHKGDLIVFPPGIPYRLLPASPEYPVRYLSACCNVSVGPFELHHVFPLPKVTSQPGKSALEPLIRAWMDASQQYDMFAERLKRDHAGNSSVPLTISLATLRLQRTLYALFTELLTLLIGHDASIQASFDPRIVKACAYIREHIRQPILLEDWAAFVHLSPSHFSHLFRQTLGQSPMDYLRRYRLRAAKDLLVRTDMPIKEIAEQVGYAEQSQFTRAFRKVENITPLAYRLVWQRNQLRP